MHFYFIFLCYVLTSKMTLFYVHDKKKLFLSKSNEHDVLLPRTSLREFFIFKKKNS